MIAQNQTFSPNDNSSGRGDLSRLRIRGLHAGFAGFMARTSRTTGFNNAKWELAGPAANAMRFMATMYGESEGGKKLVEHV